MLRSRLACWLWCNMSTQWKITTFPPPWLQSCVVVSCSQDSASVWTTGSSENGWAGAHAEGNTEGNTEGDGDRQKAPSGRLQKANRSFVWCPSCSHMGWICSQTSVGAAAQMCEHTRSQTANSEGTSSGTSRREEAGIQPPAHGN